MTGQGVVTDHAEGKQVPGWVEQAVFWQIYPLGFTGAEAEASDQVGVVHRLGHIKSWLDYAVELGASGLLLGPIFVSSTHGYDTIDYFQIDPRLGDDADFDALIEAAHGHGLRVVLDGVFNHVGREFPLFSRAVAAGPDAPDPAWFRLSWPADRARGRSRNMRPSKAIVSWWLSIMTNLPSRTTLPVS